MADDEGGESDGMALWPFQLLPVGSINKYCLLGGEVRIDDIIKKNICSF